MSNQAQVALLAFVVVVAGVIAGCGPDAGRQRTKDSAAGATLDSAAVADTAEDRVSPEAQATQALLKRLADRDEAILEMARIAVTRKEQLQVSAAARNILGETRKESNRLLSVLKGDYRVTHKPRIGESDQAGIDSLQGVGYGEFDQAFRDIVAGHQAEDARLIEQALPGVEPRMRDMLADLKSRRLADAATLRRQATRKPASPR